MEHPDPVGVDAMLYHGERQFPQAKSLSMLLSTLALDEARKHGCWDAILIDRQGELLEGSRSSLYWFDDGQIFSPEPAKILAGLTRQHFIRALEAGGVKVQQGRLMLEDMLQNPRPLVLSSTSIAIQPVKRILSSRGWSTPSVPARPSSRGQWITLPEEPRIREFAGWYRAYLA